MSDLLLKRYEIAYGKSNRLFQRPDGTKYIKFAGMRKCVECPPDSAKLIELTTPEGIAVYELGEAITAIDVMIANKSVIAVKAIDVPEGGAQ
ncbi:hypothetical protein [Rhodoflexus caldus]|uniref:hypothetical protein n=1 Tax=Rhodoflexus caldus TaxID=2891236 RepID=UPI00202A4A12|nr:hypothetical protein [Rhodoflexus caldus]